MFWPFTILKTDARKTNDALVSELRYANLRILMQQSDNEALVNELFHANARLLLQHQDSSALQLQLSAANRELRDLRSLSSGKLQALMLGKAPSAGEQLRWLNEGQS
jgi:hypothetical protein